VLEKVEYFRKLLHEEAVAVQGYCSGNIGSSMPSSDPELSICTIEKANGIVNRLLHENRSRACARHCACLLPRQALR
jgi:hypothetical protein